MSIPQVPSQDILAYFRPTHGGQRMFDWGEMHFPIHVDADPPVAPPNLGVNPPFCTPVNSFAFSWDQPSDTGIGTIAGYWWRVNGGSLSWTTERFIPAGAFAQFEGVNTFEVAAQDGVGNMGPYALITFCWESGCGGQEANDKASMIFKMTAANQWSATERAVESLSRGESEWYRMRFQYQTKDAARFSWSLTVPGSQLLPMSGEVIPLADGQWHRFWSAPFNLKWDVGDEYRMLTFVYEHGSSAVAIDAVSLEQKAPCR
jgi:hypothetical protein